MAQAAPTSAASRSASGFASGLVSRLATGTSPASHRRRQRPACGRSRYRRRSQPRTLAEAFDDHRHSLAAAYAHRFEADGLVLAGEAVQERAQDADAGHAEGMAQGDRATVGIELVAERIDAQFARRGNDLGRKGFVDFDDVDIVDRHLRPLERLTRGLDRPQTHDLRLECRYPGGDDPGQWLDA